MLFTQYIVEKIYDSKVYVNKLANKLSNLSDFREKLQQIQNYMKMSFSRYVL